MGDFSHESRTVPVRVFTSGKVVSICCGGRHSIALTESKRVYLWGDNTLGQLGIRSISANFVTCRTKPEHIPNFKTMEFSKAVCGANYTLLLTKNGDVYGFGENCSGQIGNGTFNDQLIPVNVSKGIKFKDVVANKVNNLSVGVSMDNKYYIWGLVHNEMCLTPKQVMDSSIFDVYAKSAQFKITYETAKVEEYQDYIKIIKDEEISEELIATENIKQTEKINQADDHPSTDEGYNDEGSPCPRSIYDFVNIDSFSRNKEIIDEELKQNIRLYHVFGCHGSKVIFATHEDKVFGLGCNRDGTLGIGTIDEKILKPSLISQLCDKELVDIASGFEHCIALTGDGKCYGWGRNRYGQLGIGNIDDQTSPQLIEDISDLKVTHICCSAYSSMALTEDGDVFSWGYNTFAQLGDMTYTNRVAPIQVMIPQKVNSMSCGQNHAMAVTENGLVYVWGDNTFGQLGRSPECDRHPGRLHPMCNRPIIVAKVENVRITKAVGGPNHSLLLSSEGHVYGFGKNDCGQVGNGLTEEQHIPAILNATPNSPKIKDIVCHYDNDLSIAVSVENRIYYWGLAQSQSFLRPRLAQRSLGNSLFDVYSALSLTKITFKAVNTHDYINKYVFDSNTYQIRTIADNRYLKYNKDSNFTEDLNSTEDMIFSEDLKFNDNLKASQESKSDEDLGSKSSEELNSCENFNQHLNQEIMKFNDLVNDNQMSNDDNEEDRQSYGSDNEIFTEEDNQMIKIDEDFNNHYYEDIDKHLEEAVLSQESYLQEEPNTSEESDTTEESDISPEAYLEESATSNYQSSEEQCYSMEEFLNQLDIDYSDEKIKEDIFDIEITDYPESQSLHSRVSTDSYSDPICDSPKPESTAINGFAEDDTLTFDCPNGSDMKFICDDKIIYCHKSILESNNPNFYEFLTQISPKLIKTNEFEIEEDSLDTYRAFLQFLYGIDPVIDIRFVGELKNMAQLFDEPELENLCVQYVRELSQRIDSSNVCALYETAINQSLTNLEESCVEFATDNWKSLVKSDAFQAMDEKLSKRLMKRCI